MNQGVGVTAAGGDVANGVGVGVGVGIGAPSVPTVRKVVCTTIVSMISSRPIFFDNLTLQLSQVGIIDLRPKIIDGEVNV